MTPCASPTLLILAISARALAQAARRAGFAPLVADFFADRDTREAALGCARIDGDLSDEFQPHAVLSALARLAEEAPSPPIGFVYGAGLEAEPSLIAEIAARWPVIGNDADTVARIKDPWMFFGALEALGIAFPKVRHGPLSHCAGSDSQWLLKRTGGAGGSHIKPLDGVAEIPNHAYAQCFVEGRAISALILSDDAGTRVLGFSEQWTSPAPCKPFRYGGAVQPAELAPEDAYAMRDIACHIGDAFGLRGLGSVDFILTADGPVVLEVNPRPGATLDIFDSDAQPLLALHVVACGYDNYPPPQPSPASGRGSPDARAAGAVLHHADVGASCVPSPLRGEVAVRKRATGEGGPVSKVEQLLPLTPTFSPLGRGSSDPARVTANFPTARARASQIVFATEDVTIPLGLLWPEWAADIPQPGETIFAERPVCTAHALARSPAAARALAAQRESVILESIQAAAASCRKVQSGFRTTRCGQTSRRADREDHLSKNKNSGQFPSVNALAAPLVEAIEDAALALRVTVSEGEAGEKLIDCGAHALGGIEIGRRLGEICLGGLGTVSIQATGSFSPYPFSVTVHTSNPVIACLGSQYAGWTLTSEDGEASYYVLGSGPARALGSSEPLFEELGYKDHAKCGFLVLEADAPPPKAVTKRVAKACGLKPEDLTFLYAPTQSLAGSVQVVARCLEVALHKAHELHFRLENIVDGLGTAPLPPPAADFISSMGRTNDAIIYAGRVHLFVKGDAAAAKDLAENLPSRTSKDYGRPFADIFKAVNGDFYAIDKMLFSPALVTVTALETGESFHGGGLDVETLLKSFD